MSNMNVRPQPALTSLPTASTSPVAKASTEKPVPTKASSLAQDIVSWKEAPKSDRVKAAITATFKEVAIPYTIGGALAAPAVGAVIGGFIGMFAGTPGKGAIEGMKATVKYMPLGAAVGLGAAGVDAAVVGTVVGTAPDKQAAMTRLGGATAIIGLLTAEDAWDVVGTGVATAAESVRAGRIFDKASDAIQK